MQPRFRINPIEVVIFAGVLGVFLFSAYRLFNTSSSFQTQDREIAADASYLSLEGENCDSVAYHETRAQKVQIKGPFCGNSASSANKSQLLKTEIVNKANRTIATVFTQIDRGQFSTDFVPLNTGENAIHLRFTYSGGRVFEKEFVIVRRAKTESHIEF